MGDYYGGGMSVTMDTVQDNSSMSVSSTLPSEPSSSSSSSLSGATKGSASKKSKSNLPESFRS